MKHINIKKSVITGLIILLAAATGSAADWVKVFEMGESGHRVVFPMTAKEIIAANAENARLAAIRSAGPLKSKKPVVGFEITESGHFIEFPGTLPDKKMDLGGSVIAREDPQQKVVRVQ